MRTLLLLGALASLLACSPSTIAGPCSTSCDCDPDRAAPIKCPGTWTCNAEKWCEYSCATLCEGDAGCANPEEDCVNSFCKPRLSCR